MSTQDIVIILVLIAILVPAVRTTVVHMKGEGSCCGGPKEKAKKKHIDGTPIDNLTVKIKGMHCDNCKNRIENHLNELDGVVCKVNLPKEMATVKIYSPVEDSKIKETIENLDFEVTSIEHSA
ncbi:MAG: heavy-metal-associated domain-containing protein [Lachnospiraceae bacterium]|nr:heavy-metal-associated domain-containing protein [Lachnospiraceae bacterium]